MTSSEHTQIWRDPGKVRLSSLAKLFIGLLSLSACVGPEVIPSDLKDRVDLAVTFAQLKDDPSAYEGRLVVLGGTVLSAALLKDGTRIEVLQLPLKESHEPELELTTSQGRFLAFQKAFLDPATLPPGTPLTVVGEVTGATTLPLDESEYTYPTLTIKKLTTWPKRAQRYWDPSYPYYWHYWRPYGQLYRNPLSVIPPRVEEKREK